MENSLTPQALQRLQHMADRQEILDCLTRVLRAIDRFDRDLFLTAFHADAVIDSGGYLNSAAQVYDGAAAFHEKGQSSTIHNLLNHTCEIEGDTAHTETYLLYTGVNRDGTNWMTGGRYLDRLERRGSEWRIAFRYTLIEWSGLIPAATNPNYDNVANLFANGIPSRSKNDPSYRRPLTNRRELSTVTNPASLRLR
jgi:SnoaL-like domain